MHDYVRSGSTAKDWHITTNTLPEQVKIVYGDYRLIETGLNHGTVMVVIEHELLEITTYRIDGVSIVKETD